MSFTFFNHDVDLNNKWWHRLLKVLFIIFIILLFVISYIINVSTVEEDSFNSSRIDIESYSKSHPEEINTLPSFLNLEGKLGCYNGDKYDYIFEYQIKEKGICNADLIKNIDGIIPLIRAKYPQYKDLNVGELKSIMLKSNQRHCLIPSDSRENCKIFNIVKYKRTLSFYREVLIYSILITLVVSALLILFYYKVFLYIIYGNKKKS